MIQCSATSVETNMTKTIYTLAIDVETTYVKTVTTIASRVTVSFVRLATTTTKMVVKQKTQQAGKKLPADFLLVISCPKQYVHGVGKRQTLS